MKPAVGTTTNPPETWVDFRGYRFKPPFHCMCCGKVICAQAVCLGAVLRGVRYGGM